MFTWGLSCMMQQSVRQNTIGYSEVDCLWLRFSVYGLLTHIAPDSSFRFFLCLFRFFAFIPIRCWQAAEVRPPRKSRVQRPTSFPCRRKPIRLGCMTPICTDDQSFSARKTRLMAEARLALAQAPEVARRELSRQRELRALQRRSAVASLLLPPGARRFTRPVLSKMSVAKLQLILSDLQSQVERLNEELVKSLLQRDELNMERDGKLVDIEDLDRIEPDW